MGTRCGRQGTQQHRDMLDLHADRRGSLAFAEGENGAVYIAIVMAELHTESLSLLALCWGDSGDKLLRAARRVVHLTTPCRAPALACNVEGWKKCY